MSFTEVVGQEPQEEQEQDYDGVFQFFFQLAKPLLLELPSPEDRALAAVWIQRLQREPETEEEKRLRVDYLTLLLFVMQRGRLIGLFKNEPPPGPLEPFPEGLGLTEMGNFLLEQAELQGSGDADVRKVSYNVEISNDLREFVAAQEIPDFGIQVYYAWSVEDPIYKWTSFDETKCPQHVRDKIRQLKIVKSEEKTNVKSGSLLGEKTDSSLRKSCDSTLYDKNRAKVKTPEEIEKSLERNYHSFTNSPSQRGSARDDDGSWSPSRKSKNHSCDALSFREARASKLCGHESNTEETDDEDAVDGAGSSPCYCGSNYRHTSDGCPHSNCKPDTDTSKRLQKCDDAVENGPSQVNQPSYMAGPSQRTTDKCHEKEMYSESVRCGGEAAPAPKSPCSPARGIQMSQALSQPSVKSRKSRCSAQAYQSQEEDPNKKCYCSPKTKAPSAPSEMRCSCPCPKAEKEAAQSEIPCFKKKERSQSEKACPKSKTDSTPAKKPQEQSCPVMEEAMKSCYRKMRVEAPEGCTCGEDRHKHQLAENLSRIGREKMVNEPCQQEQQQYACSRKKSEKRDKRAVEQSEPIPGSCSKNRSLNAEDMKRRPEAFKDLYATQRSQQAVNASCCQQGSKLQDNRGPGRPYPGDYPPNGLGYCSRNQDLETKMHGRPAREGEYMDRRCETEVKELKYSPRQGQEYPGNDQMSCTARRMPAQHAYPSFQESPPRPNGKTYNKTCVCNAGGQSRDEEVCDNASSGSDENFVEEGDGQDDVGVDPNNNPEEECQIDLNANEDGNAECPQAAENYPHNTYDFFDGTTYQQLPSKIRLGYGLNETSRTCQSPGYGHYTGAEEELMPQPLMAPFVTPVSRQKYLDTKFSLPSRRKIAADPRDFPRFNKSELPQNPQYGHYPTPMREGMAAQSPQYGHCSAPVKEGVAAQSPQYGHCSAPVKEGVAAQSLQYGHCSTPVKEGMPPVFAHSPVSTIPQYHRGRYSEEDDLVPIHVGYQGGRTYSIHKDKDNTSGRRKKIPGEQDCSRVPMQYMTLQDDGSENPEMVRGMHCGTGNINDPSVDLQSQKWLDHQMKSPNCHHQRDSCKDIVNGDSNPFQISGRSNRE